MTDGPFAETNEVVGGDAVLEVKSKEEAIEGAKWLMQLFLKHIPDWEGEAEVRQMFGPEDGPPQRDPRRHHRRRRGERRRRKL